MWKRECDCKHEKLRSHCSAIVSFNHNSQTIFILHCREARGSREKHSKYIIWWIDVFFLKFQAREERSLFQLNSSIISFHFIVIYWVAAVCHTGMISLWRTYLVLIFTGENIKQVVSLNVARVLLGKGRTLLLLRLLNMKTCCQMFLKYFFWKLFENKINSLMCWRLWFSLMVPKSDSIRII